MIDRARPIFIAAWSSVVFASIGCALSIIGPTLLDLAGRLSVENDVIALIFPVRAVGAFIGTAASGYLFDRLQRYSYLMIAAAILLGVAPVCLVPLSIHIAMLGVVMFFYGFFLQGFLINGAQSVLLKACQKLKRLPSYVMFLHFSYALGATIAPLWAGLVVSKGSSSGFNISCSEIGGLALQNSSGNMDRTNAPCSVITNNSSVPTMDITYVDGIPDTSLLFGWAYWLCAPIFLTALAAFLYFSVTYELKRCHRTCGDSPSRTHGYDIIVADNTHPEPSLQSVTREGHKMHSLSNQRLITKIIFFVLTSLLTYFSVAVEACVTNYLFTYAVQGAHFTKERAANLNSLFWGMYATFRLLAVFLSLLKTPSSVLIMFNLTGGLLTSLAVALFPNQPIVTWFGAALIGVCMSSTFPSIVAWLAQQTEVTGKVSALLVCSSTLADMTVPVTIATLMARITPLSFIYFVATDYGIAILLAIVLFSFTGAMKCCCSKQCPGSDAASMESGSPAQSTCPEQGEEDLHASVLLLAKKLNRQYSDEAKTEAPGHLAIQPSTLGRQTCMTM